MLTPSQEFHKAKKDFEKIHNEHAVRLTQQQYKHEVELSEKIKKQIAEAQNNIKVELNNELLLLSQAIQRIEQKLRDRFGPP